MIRRSTDSTSKPPTAFDDLSQGIPKVGATRVDPVVRAVGRKLLRTTQYTSNAQFGVRRSLNTDRTGLFSRISEKTASAIVDNRNAMQVLPDLEIVMNLLVSSILAPKDLVTTEITYSLRNKVVRAEIAQKMLEVIRTHFETYHKLKEILEPALEDSLFKTGSYPVLILAENTVDQIINGQQHVTLESFSGQMTADKTAFKPIGYLGNRVEPGSTETAENSLGLEGFGLGRKSSSNYDPKSFLDGLTITDNPNILKLPKIRDRMRADKVAQLLHRSGVRTTLENVNPADELVESLYRPRNYVPQDQANVPTTGASPRPTVGHPLVMKLPSEAVIPVHEPSNPSKHLGYFILVDPTSGSPVMKSTEEDYYREMTVNYSQNQSMVSGILREAKRLNQGLGTLDINQTDVHRLEQLYGDVLEYELNSRLKRGVYGAGATVARPEEIYRIMLARALAGKMTQLLYVPEEMLIYIAFDYNQYGIGVSLLTKSIILAGQRANLSIASVMAELKNAVARSKVTITLDEEDDDPSGTVEHAITEQAKLRRSSYPMFVSAPNDIVDWLQNAAVEFEINGNTGYPSTKVDISDYNSNKTVPNIELQKDLRDRHLWSFGIPPELVDTARGSEFATSIVTNNLMLIKTVLRHQQTFTPFLEDYVRTYTLSDGILMEELREIIRAAKRNPSTDGLQTTTSGAKDKIGGSKGDDVDRLIIDFLNDIQVDLPKPEGAKTQNIQEAYEKQQGFVEKVLEAYVSDAAISNELAGLVGGQTDTLKNALVALFMRRWVRENGALPMMDELTELGENDSPGLDLLAEIEAHSSPMKINLRDFLVKGMRRKAADDKVIQTVEEQTGADAGSGGGGGSYDAGGETTDAGGDAGGDGGFGDISFDAGGDDEGGEGEDGEGVGGETSSEESSESTETTTSEDGTATTTSSSSSSNSSSS